LLPRSFVVYLETHFLDSWVPDSLDILMNPMRVEVNDKMQKGYVYSSQNRWVCAFRPGFTLEVTPKQMLKLACLAGNT